ncbi:MAG: alpha/beta hydrolase [Chitinophagaceae bacterium]|nr:alpha/beta hydrolase [Chitinophagaceae bacterium]
MHKITIQLCYIFILQLFLINNIFGQLPPAVMIGEKAYFTQNINAEKFAGKPFQLIATTKVQADADSAKSAIIVLVRNKDNSIGFHTDITRNLKNNPNWTETNINGKIDSNAKTIEIGGYCNGDGVFLFDDFQLKVETSPGIWKQIPIDNGGFEKGNFENWIVGSNGKPLNFDGAKFSVQPGKSFKGKFCLKVECKYTSYGNNDKSGNFVTVNGIKLYYETYGSGEPLLLLHGNGGSISGQAVRIASFRNKYKVIAVDSRAQGKSGDDGQELTYDLMADDLNKLLEYLKIDSAYIWGQSDGGIIGLILAMKYQDKVKKLAVWGANVQADSNAFTPGIYESVVTASKTGKTEKDRQLNTLMAKYPNIPFSDLKTIQAPVLVMAGDRDAISLTHTINIFQNISNSQLFVMPGASHYGAYEKPALFNIILSDFFDTPFKKP